VSRPAVVQFPIYREYEENRQNANNAIVALLAGSTLAVHTLQLTEGSTHLLPEIFPAVPHISRFNLRPDAASKVLEHAGSHLAIVTVPYALAIYEDFVMKCIRWLINDVGLSARPASRSKPKSANMHERVADLVGGSFEAHEDVAEEVFHIFRLMRNCHIHRGGAASKELRRQIRGMSAPACSRWFDLTRRKTTNIVFSGRAEYSLFDVFSIFAITKELSRAVNRILKDNLSERQWAKICVQDYASETSRPPRSDDWGRGLVGYVSHRYGSAGLSSDALFAAAAQLGVWPDAQRRP